MDPLPAELARFLDERVLPAADELDRDAAACRAAIDEMRARGLLDFQLADAAGVRDRLPYSWHYFNAVARRSGALAFLLKQNSVACAYLRSREAVSPALAALRDEVVRGERTLGISFSCAEVSPGGEAVRAEDAPSGGHVELSGPLRWASGRGVFDLLLVDLFRGDEVFLAPLPFRDEPEGRLRLSAPLALFALGSTGTVSGRLARMPVGAEWLCGPFSLAELMSKGSTYVTHCFMLLGSAEGALDYLRGGASYAPPPAEAEAYRAALGRWQAALGARKARLFDAGAGAELDWALREKVETADFAQRCVQFVLACAGARAAAAGAPPHRSLREVTMFALMGNHPRTRAQLFGYQAERADLGEARARG